MTFRPTTLERAYQLAESGACRTVSEVKQALQSEGYERIQDSLYGGTITAALHEEEKVQLMGFGSFEVKKRAARTGRNPRSKETIEIPASQTPVFKAGKALKDAVAK